MNAQLINARNLIEQAGGIWTEVSAVRPLAKMSDGKSFNTKIVRVFFAELDESEKKEYTAVAAIMAPISDKIKQALEADGFGVKCVSVFDTDVVIYWS